MKFAMPLLTALLSAGAHVAIAQTSLPASAVPSVVREIGFDQHPNALLPVGLHFRDEQDADVTLGRYFDGRRPVVLALVYYGCPMLCLQTLGNLAASVDALPLRAGKDFEIVTVSFDPHETPALAQSKKTALLKKESDSFFEERGRGWHFLTGEQTSIRQRTEAVGFKYVFDDSLNQFAHPAGLMILTPDARIARYIFGIDDKPLDLRLALVEASERRISSATSSLLLYCYHYEPSTGRYGLMIMRLVRTAGAATVLGMAGLILFFLRRERRGLR